MVSQATINKAGFFFSPINVIQKFLSLYAFLEGKYTV